MTDSIDELISKGIHHGENFRVGDALDCFTKALQLDKNNLNAWSGAATAWQNMAEHYRRSSNNEKMLESAEHSEKCWNEVLQRNDSNIEAWFGKGSVILDYLGKSEEALNCFQKTLELDKNHVEALMNMGILLDHNDQILDAITCFKLALKLDDTNQPLWFNSGVTLAKQGLHKEALDCFNKSIDLNDMHVNSWLFKSKILKTLGCDDESEICMKKYNELTKNN